MQPAEFHDALYFLNSYDASWVSSVTTTSVRGEYVISPWITNAEYRLLVCIFSCSTLISLI